MEPGKYKVEKLTATAGSFANNDIEHTDPTGADHETFAYGLKKSLLNYMHGACLDLPLYKWFDTETTGMKVPKTSVPPDYIAKALEEDDIIKQKPDSKIVWLGNMPLMEIITKSKKGNSWELCSLTFETKKETVNIKVNETQGRWLYSLFQELTAADKPFTLLDVKANYEAAGLEDFELFWDNKPVTTLYKAGLLQL